MIEIKRVYNSQLYKIKKKLHNYKIQYYYWRSQRTKVKPSLLPLYNQPSFIESKKILEEILTTNIIPFWYPQVVDLKEGGYCLNHNIKGKWQGKSPKNIVAQARTLWFFSKLTQTEYGNQQHLQAAKHGYDFLYNSIWDHQFGGFYWQVDSSGSNPTISDKHLYGQAFALDALCEYAIASSNQSALNLAKQLFQAIQKHTYDHKYGGYQEYLRRDWSLLSSENLPDGLMMKQKKIYQEQKDVSNLSQSGEINTLLSFKQLNTHLHLMRAFTNYYLVTKDPIAKDKLIELILIQSNTVLRKNIGGCTDVYQKDWTPITNINTEFINYGHDLENIWFLIEACDAVGFSNYLLIDFYKTVLNYALKYGFDKKKGGFYLFGYYNCHAHNLEKYWWVQAEALVASLKMYHLTRKEEFYTCFCQILDWIIKHQVDWQEKEWYSQILPNGEKIGDKAGPWKSPYHNGRAMFKCLQILSEIN